MAELSAEQWTQAKRLFARAAELPPEQRASFLERECPDEDVLQEVASLLEHPGSLQTASEVIASVAAAVAVEKRPRPVADWRPSGSLSSDGRGGARRHGRRLPGRARRRRVPPGPRPKTEGIT